MAGGTVHGPPYKECRLIAAWYGEYQPLIAARIALVGADVRACDYAWLVDFTFGIFLEMGTTEQGDKKLEWIKKVIHTTRPELAISHELPGTPVNE